MNKSEKERMLAGEFYNSRDPELLGMYHRARRLLGEFNHTASSDAAMKEHLLRELLGELGRGVWIEAPFYCDYGEYITIGDNSFVNFNCMFLDCNRIEIGKNALIAPNVQIYTAYHPLDARERIRKDWHEGDDQAIYRTQAAPVTVGDNVWIGGGTIVLPGVRIGSNSTVGAGSVVTKDVPEGVLALGNPCRVVRKISP